MLVSLKYDIQPSISFQSLEAEPKALNQHFRGYFPHKSCLLAMGQHCASNFLVQCWPRQIQTTLQIIFLWKFVCGLRANIAQVIFLSMLAKTDQEKILWVIFSQKDCPRGSISQTTDNIAPLLQTTLHRKKSRQCFLNNIWSLRL